MTSRNNFPARFHIINFNILCDVSETLNPVPLLSERTGLSLERKSNCCCQFNNLSPPLDCERLLGRDQVFYFCIHGTQHRVHHLVGKYSVTNSRMDNKEAATTITPCLTVVPNDSSGPEPFLINVFFRLKH